MRRHNLWLAATAGLVLASSIVPGAGAKTTASTAADKNANKIFDDLDRTLDASAASKKLDIVALFSDGNSKAKVANVRKSVGPFAATYEYQTMSGFAASLTAGQIRSLALRSDVAQIQLDARMEFQMDMARGAAGVDKARADFGYDGNNELSSVCPGVRQYCTDDVVIAVLDSGVDKWHVDLDGGKVLGGTDCWDATCDDLGWWSMDTRDHGTLVASIAAGEGDGNASMQGIAPGAAIVSVKVGDTPTISSVDASIEWVLANKDRYSIDLVNMSLSTTASSAGTDSTARLTNKLTAAGITPFVSAGNGNPEPGRTGSPAAAKFSTAVGSMADPSTPTLGDGAGFVLALTSRRGPTLDGRTKPDIVSHGVEISGADANSTNGYISNSGTSFSSPFAAGVGALMLDANPALAPSGTACPVEDVTPECSDGVIDSTMTVPLKDTMMLTAADWGGPGTDNEYGAGRLDGYAAVDAASPQTGTGGPRVPTHVHHSGTLATTGSTVSYPIAVTATDYGITAAVIMVDRGAGATTPDFDVTILNPTGQVVASSQFTEQNHRQETASLRPTSTGTYTVRLRSAAGGGRFWLDVSYGGTTAPPPPPPTEPPPTPMGLTATAVSGSAADIDLSWGDVTTESGYKIERSADGAGGWVQIATTPSDVTTYRNSALAASTTYFYRVRATNVVGDSGYSNTVSARTNGDSIAPSVPTGVKATAGKLKVTLTWAASADSGGSGLAGYKVYRSTTSTGTYSQIAAVTSTGYTDTAVTKGKIYYYYLVSYDRAGNHSAASVKVSGKPT